jgi:enoyl-CoA hydratase/carnithine racemase
MFRRIVAGVDALFSSEVLLVERQGTVFSITLNRPAKYNALNVALNRDLLRALQSVSSDVTVVVLRGAGKHFCAGSDLHDLYRVDRREAERVIRLEMEACSLLAALPQLTVAVLHGKCFGGGAFLPLYCDLRLGRAGVEFALPEVSLGWVPPYGLERLLAGVPRSFALEMLLTGRTCGDREALEKGWIQRLLGPDEREMHLLEKLGEIPEETLRDTLGLVSAKNLKEIHAADERALQAFIDHFDTDHARARIASFVERKRS